MKPSPSNSAPRQWAMLQQGTRPHCKQAAGLFTWPNCPNPMGHCVLRIRPWLREAPGELRFPCQWWDRHMPKDWWQNNGRTSDSIQIPKVNIICTRVLAWVCSITQIPQYVSNCQYPNHSKEDELYGGFNLIKVTDHSGGGSTRH